MLSTLDRRVSAREGVRKCRLFNDEYSGLRMVLARDDEASTKGSSEAKLWVSRLRSLWGGSTPVIGSWSGPQETVDEAVA